MRSILRAAALVALASGLATAAHADVFTKEQLIHLNKDKPAGGQGVLEYGCPQTAGVGSRVMQSNSFNNLPVHPKICQYPHGIGGMGGKIRLALRIQVMQQSCQSPLLRIFSEFLGQCPQDSLRSKRVIDEVT